jgi:FkbM family methyltransferase
MTITSLTPDSQFKNLIVNKTPITICDIGASQSDPTPFIDELLNNTNSVLYGFEPNEDEFKKLIQTDKKKYFNIALGNGNIETLNICHEPGMTSILKPDYDYLDLFHGFKEWANIIKTINIQTKKLDEINFENKIDFFKIDVQGYESKIINYGEIKIKESLIVQIETSPVPLYKDEKSFSSICSQLENLGFNLHMFNKINTRCFKPFALQDNIYLGLHHLFQLDCVFIKSFSLINNLNSEELKKMALILFYSFKSDDLVDFLIQKISQMDSVDYISEYRKLMSSIKINKSY